LRNDAPVSALDEATFEALYVRLERPLYNAAFRYVWHAEDARDVVQEAFMKMWDARARIEIDGAEAYAWRAVLNTAMNKRRWHKLRSFTGLESLVSSKPSAHDELSRKRDDETVRKAVDALPDDLKRVLLLSEIGGMKHDDIARVLDIAPGTVASRRSRAFDKLRAVLGTSLTIGDEEVAHAVVR
jgi:RNA polymerase sigma-70 factor, ECF subfamily